MRRVIAIVALATLTAASLAFAHDTWLRSESASVAAGATVTFHLTSGEGFATDDFAIERSRLVEAHARVGHTLVALTPIAGGEQQGGAGALLLHASLPTTGVATAWIRLAPKQLTLTPAKQIEYLDDIHATEIVRARWTSMREPRRWRELYVKHAKAMMRVGAPSASDMSWALPTERGLEILPERDPTAMHAGDQLSVRVLSNGRAISGLPVGAVHDGEPEAEWHVTDGVGRATFTLAKGGAWMLHGTDLRPSSKPGREWESDFATLTFTIAAAAR